jgi:hypothetical protein
MQDDQRVGQITDKKHAKRLKYLLAAATLACVVMIMVVVVYRRSHSILQIKLPSTVTEQARFPIYLPTRLPRGFEVAEDSFSYDQGVLIFKANNKIGDVIAITEQPKPDNFDFENFYAKQLTQSKQLRNVPFPSTIGTSTEVGSHVLSVVTNKTWLLISSRAPLAESDLQLIAGSLRLH